MPIDDATQRQTPEETPTVHQRVQEGGVQNRFTPGTLILGRYRIINLLGRGGMGEVYRADDLKLGQQVALKFIPRELLVDPNMLRMLFAEVRIGRDVSHPNVCRLYDVVEFDGDHFISMQFVDGEDLASLLRRIGRLPVEKAIDLARDLAAGLAAAHERAVIHRDLKPANVMIDGRGRAHVTDFGLAIVSDDPQRRGLAGTPVYMAPEQLSGQVVTTASDVYAFGLIIWEMLTGKRMFDPGSLTQIAQAHNEPKPRLTSSIRDLPPKIEALVMQCLDEEPERRPQSAREVLAMLPGGDPLAAAVAAGETPSPELVAAAAKTGSVPAAVAIGALAAFVVMLAAVAFLNPRSTIFSFDHFRKSPDVLIDRAEEIVRVSGITGDPADRAGSFADRGPRAPRGDRWTFVYRRSRSAMAPRGVHVMVSADDPPLKIEGMANVTMTGDGRLLSFVAVPRRSAAPMPAAIDAMFRAAGYDRSKLQPVAPEVAPPVGCDARQAWNGPVHIEAATFRGAPVWFEVNPTTPVAESGTLIGIGGYAYTFVLLLLLSVAVILAWRNVQAGRGDRRGALRALIIATGCGLVAETASAHIASSQLSGAIESILGNAMLDGGMFWLSYMAVEPYVRRHWPHSLISWQRLIDLRWRDSLVARDGGIGMMSGLSTAVLMRLCAVAVGNGPPKASSSILWSLNSLPSAVNWVLHCVPEAMNYALYALLFLTLGHVFLRKAVIYMPLFVILLGLAFSGHTGNVVVDVVYGFACATLIAVVMRFSGMLAICFSWMTYHLLEGLPLTLDTSTWFAGRAFIVAALLIALAAYAWLHAIAPGRRFANVPATA